MMPFLFGKSVDLKVLDELDIELVREWRNSEDVSNFMLSRTFISKEQQGKWYESIKKNSEYVYWIILSKNGLKLGLASFTKIDRTNHSAEPGLLIIV